MPDPGWLRAWSDPMQEHLLGLGLSRVRKTIVVIDPDVRDTPRHFAVTEILDFDLDLGAQDLRIRVAPALRELPSEQQQAILLHEWGHVVDFTYPASIEVQGPLAWTKITPSEAQQRRWSKRDRDAIEHAADRLVLGLFGIQMRYASLFLLQGWSGQRRPKGLR